MARAGQIPCRTQSSVAVGDDKGRWFLINAAADLPDQIESNPALQPNASKPRNSPISGVLLTNADLDHLLGLFSMREGSPVHVRATKAVQTVANRFLGVGPILDAFSGTIWSEPPTEDFAPLADARGLMFRAIELPGGPPAFARGASVSGAHSVAYQFLDWKTGGRLLVAPDVGGINDALAAALNDSDVVLFDGTFWSEDELRAVKPKAPQAGGMGHVTIRDCSLGLLGKIAARQKIYIHINNTNPILNPASPERAQVEAAGIVVGSDRLEFFL
jgi:pyrroloquinoline quinone biosynthesis protein B